MQVPVLRRLQFDGMIMIHHTAAILFPAYLTTSLSFLLLFFHRRPSSHWSLILPTHELLSTSCFQSRSSNETLIARLECNWAPLFIVASFIPNQRQRIYPTKPCQKLTACKPFASRPCCLLREPLGTCQTFVSTSKPPRFPATCS